MSEEEVLEIGDKRRKNQKGKKNTGKKKVISSDEEMPCLDTVKPKTKTAKTSWKRKLRSSSSSSSEEEDSMSTVLQLSANVNIWFTRFKDISYIHFRNKKKNKNFSLSLYEVKKLFKFQERIKLIMLSEGCE